MPRIATRYLTSDAIVDRQIYQRLSFVLWSLMAMAIISRAPMHVTEVDHPVLSLLVRQRVKKRAEKSDTL